MLACQAAVSIDTGRWAFSPILANTNKHQYIIPDLSIGKKFTDIRFNSGGFIEFHE